MILPMSTTKANQKLLCARRWWSAIRAIRSPSPPSAWLGLSLPQKTQKHVWILRSNAGTDYIDFYLLHNMGGARTAKFDEYGMWEWAAQKKAEGVIKHLGFSMHDNAETLDKLLTDHPDMDFVQLQVNYLDWEDPMVESRKCMEVAQKHGVPVVIMEPARGGRLADLPERGASVLEAANPNKSVVSWAYRFCYNLPNVISVLSGVSTLEQIQENVREWKANEPLSASEEKGAGRCG